MIPEFKNYNRQHYLEMKKKELIEEEWDRELQMAMNASDPLGVVPEESHGAHSKPRKKKSAKEDQTDLTNKLQNIDFIDRTPSPVDRLDTI